jgi:hypothetical protein
LQPRKQDEHGRVLAVAAILVAELLDQIALFQLNLANHSAGVQAGIPAVARAVARPAAGGLMPRNFLPNVRFAPEPAHKIVFPIDLIWSVFARSVQFHAEKPDTE